MLGGATDLQVVFYKMERSSSPNGKGAGRLEFVGNVGSATVTGASELFVSPHQLPDEYRIVGSQGMIGIGLDMLGQFTVKEIHEGATDASGWVVIGVGWPLSGYLAVACDYTTPLALGTRLYVVGYPQGDLGPAAEEPIREQRIVPFTVVNPSRASQNWLLDEFIVAEPSYELGMHGASGSGVYMINSMGSPVRVGIYGGAVAKEGERGWYGLIVRPQPSSEPDHPQNAAKN